MKQPSLLAIVVFGVFGILVLALTGLAGCDSARPNESRQNEVYTSAQPSSTFTQYQSGEPVVRGTPLNFPADHGSHPNQSIEWWYITGNLMAENGESFGVQWTLFRARLPNEEQTLSSQQHSPQNPMWPWWQGQFYFAHFALQSNRHHHAFERFGRVGQVQIHASPFHASLDDWVLASQNTAQPNAFLPLRLQAQEQSNNQIFGVNLTLDNSPLVAHGDAGYSQKTPQGNASYYYSLPFLSASGTVTFAGQTYAVTGDAWLDREWSGGLLSQDFTGWDWFSLQSQVETNTKQGRTKQGQPSKRASKRTAIMAFCLRDKNQAYRYCDATRITHSQQSNLVTSEVIPQHAIQLQTTQTAELDGRHYPVQWQLSLAEQTFQINAVNPDSRNQLTFPYWEGRVTFQEITPNTAQSLKGKGYAELTGY